MSTAPTVDTDRILAGLNIVDCDAHFTEPPDLWTSRAPKSHTRRRILQDNAVELYGLSRPGQG